MFKKAPVRGKKTSQMTGNRNEMIPGGRTEMHPRSFEADELTTAAAKTERTLSPTPRRTGKFKG